MTPHKNMTNCFHAPAAPAAAAPDLMATAAALSTLTSAAARTSTYVGHMIYRCTYVGTSNNRNSLQGTNSYEGIFDFHSCNKGMSLSDLK